MWRSVYLFYLIKIRTICVRNWFQSSLFVYQDYWKPWQMLQMWTNTTGILEWGHQHGQMEIWSPYHEWLSRADPATSRAGARASSWDQGMPHCSSSLSAVTGGSDRHLESLTDFNSSWNSFCFTRPGLCLFSRQLRETLSMKMQLDQGYS